MLSGRKEGRDCRVTALLACGCPPKFSSFVRRTKMQQKFHSSITRIGLRSPHLNPAFITLPSALPMQLDLLPSNIQFGQLFLSLMIFLASELSPEMPDRCRVPFTHSNKNQNWKCSLRLGEFCIKQHEILHWECCHLAHEQTQGLKISCLQDLNQGQMVSDCTTSFREKHN